MQRVVQRDPDGSWSIRAEEHGQLVGTFSDQGSAVREAQVQLQSSDAGGLLRVYSAAGEIVESRDVASLVKGERSEDSVIDFVGKKIQVGIPILFALVAALAVPFPALVAALFSPAVEQGMKSGQVGAAVATLAWTAGMGVGTYIVVLAKIRGIQIFFVYLIVVILTGAIASLIGLPSVFDGLRGTGGPFQLGINLVVAAIQVYSLGGAFLGVVIGCVAGWRVARAQQALRARAEQRQ